MESMGGNPARWALRSVGSTPARWANVAYQSQPQMIESSFVPRFIGGTRPPLDRKSRYAIMEQKR